MVSFLDGTSLLGTSALGSNGMASLVTSSLSLGGHTISAVYSGAGNFLGSTSATLTIGVLTPGTVPSFTLPSLLNEVSGVQGGDPADLDYSASGHVRYSDGAAIVTATDLLSTGFGAPFGVTRTWTSMPVYGNNTTVSPMVNLCGNGWQIDQLPWLMQQGDTIIAMTGPGTERYFDEQDDGTYKDRYFLQDTLVHNTAKQQFILTDTSGDQICFWDFSNNLQPANRGVFYSLTDPGGNVTHVTDYYPNTGMIAEIQRGSGHTFESFYFRYVDGDSGMLANVTWRTGPNTQGPWTTVQSVDYTYYGLGEDFGNPGDLKQVQTRDKDGNVIATDYCRYYYRRYLLLLLVAQAQDRPIRCGPTRQ